MSLSGQRIIVEAMEVAEAKSLKPGEFLFDKKLDCLIVGSGEGNLKITQLKPEGKSSMSASAFYNGIKSKGLTQFDLQPNAK